MALVSNNLFRITATDYWHNQLAKVDVAIFNQKVGQEIGVQKGPVVLSGYVGGEIEKNLSDDFTEKLDLKELVVKYWVNEDKSTLKTIALFSKHNTAPFFVHTHSNVMHMPPNDDNMNNNYVQILKTEGIDGAYRMLKDNPTEFPLIPRALLEGELGLIRTQVYPDGRVDFRKEVERRIDDRNPHRLTDLPY
jgi:hypothetical protein